MTNAAQGQDNRTASLARGGGSIRGGILSRSPKFVKAKKKSPFEPKSPATTAAKITLCAAMADRRLEPSLRPPMMDPYRT